MARRKKGRMSARSRKPHIPLAIAAPAAIDGMMVLNTVKNGFTSTEQSNLAYYFTGWNGTSVDFGRVVNTYGKYAAGALIHMGATKFGVNKQLYKLTGGYVGL